MEVEREAGPVPNLHLEDFPPDELPRWRERSMAEYLAGRVAAGESLEEATQAAGATDRQLFPGGRPAPLHRLGWVVHDGQRVGELWVGPAGDDPERWWVWEIAIYEAWRGRGLGRRAMLLAEELARAAGATTIGLNVFGANHVARRLYASLGYAETSVQMRKPLA